MNAAGSGFAVFSRVFSASSFAFRSECGFVRARNEDSLLCLPERGLFAVSDGIGGADAGDMASSMIADMLRKTFLALPLSASFEVRKTALLDAVLQASKSIVRYRKQHFYHSMGATVTAYIADPDAPANGFICHSGDSRLYRYSDGVLSCMTSDHTLTADYRRLHPEEPPLPEHLSHILTRAVGMEDSLPPDAVEFSLQPGTQLLLCSDGLHSLADDGQISQILKASESAEDVVAALEALVKSEGAPDNYSFICLRPELS